jgi:large subunit ribosomal protein L35
MSCIFPNKDVESYKIFFLKHMPKLKTNSSAKKGRFKVTGTGKVLATQANKRHNMRKRSLRQLRNQQGTVTLNDIEAKRALSYMPYSRKKKTTSSTTTSSTTN